MQATLNPLLDFVLKHLFWKGVSMTAHKWNWVLVARTLHAKCKMKLEFADSRNLPTYPNDPQWELDVKWLWKDIDRSEWSTVHVIIRASVLAHSWLYFSVENCRAHEPRWDVSCALIVASFVGTGAFEITPLRDVIPIKQYRYGKHAPNDMARCIGFLAVYRHHDSNHIYTAVVSAMSPECICFSACFCPFPTRQVCQTMLRFYALLHFGNYGSREKGASLWLSLIVYQVYISLSSHPDIK